MLNFFQQLPLRRPASTRYGLYLFFFLLFNLYVWKVFPDMYWGDSGEFAFRSLFLGIPHPTGYPTYIQLLNLVSLFPVGSPFFLINFSSALFAFLALICLYKIVFLLTRKVFPALFTVTLFAFSTTFLSKIDRAEVYTLQVLLVLAIVYLSLLGWRDFDRRKVMTIAFLLGLGVTNHMTTVIIIPVIGLFVLYQSSNRREAGKTVALSIPFFLLGLLPYLFIFLRKDLPAPINYTQYFAVDLSSWEGWYWLLSGKLFRYEMMPGDLNHYLNEIGFFAFTLFHDFAYLPAIVGLWGMTGQFRLDRERFFFLFSLFAALTGFFIYYRISDIQDYYTISFAIFSIWIGLGAERLLLVSRTWRFAIGKACYAVFVAIGLWSVLAGFSAEKRNSQEYALEYGHKLFATLPKGSLICTTYTAKYNIFTLQKMAALRPDISLFDYGNFTLAERARLAKLFNPRDEHFPNRMSVNLKNTLIPHLKEELGKRPVFFSRDESFLYDQFLRTPQGDGLYRIALKEPPQVVSALPPTTVPIALTVSNGLHFLGYEQGPMIEGEPFLMDFYWQTTTPLGQELVGLLLLHASGSKETSSLKNEFFSFTLGSDLLPPNRWKQGDIMRDRFQFNVESGLIPGEYDLRLALFEKGYFEGTPFKRLSFHFVDIGKATIRENPKLMHYWDE